MRPIKVTMTAAGVSSWIPINNMHISSLMGINVSLTNGSNLTYSVQYSYDNPNANLPCTLRNSGTTAFVTMTNSSDATIIGGDSIVIGSANSPWSGTFAVLGLSGSDYVISLASTPTSVPLTPVASPMKVYNYSTLTTKTATADGVLELPIKAIRLNIQSISAGSATMTVIQAN